MNFSLNSPACGLRLCSLVVALGALAHLVRLLLGFQIVIGSHPVPVWLSGVAVIVLGLISGWLWKLSRLGPAPPAPVSAPPPAAPTA